MVLVSIMEFFGMPSTMVHPKNIYEVPLVPNSKMAATGGALIMEKLLIWDRNIVK